MDFPSIGLGTLGLKESAEAAVGRALNLGCDLVDTGEHYGNLELVGAALGKAKAKDEKKPFIVIKLSGLPAGDYGPVHARAKAMLDRLGIVTADLCLMHWPGLCTWDPTDMEPLAGPTEFHGKASTWAEFCANIASGWANMEKLKEQGLVSRIGTSNFYPHHLAELARQSGGAVPFANEIFIDSSNQECEFVVAMQKAGIKVLAYRPVAYKPFPEGVVKVAGRHNVSPQSVVLGWLLRRGVYPLVKCRGEHISENLTVPVRLKDKLSPEDLQDLEQGAPHHGLRYSPEWFAKIWSVHNQESAVSEDDVQALVSMGVEEAKARSALEKCMGNLDAAMDAAFS